MKNEKVNIIVSSCLLGDNVRFDGNSKTNKTLISIQDNFNFIKVCPEISLGLPVPRKAIRYTVDGDLIYSGSKKSIDANKDKFSFVDNYDFVGFVGASKSPSCGVGNAKVYCDDHVVGYSDGYFLKYLKDRPISFFSISSGKLYNEIFRNTFFIKCQMLSELKGCSTIHDLVVFHSKNKYILMCFNQNILRELGSLIGNHNNNFVDVFEKYITTFMKIDTVNVGNLQNVFFHIYGYFKKMISQNEKDFILNELETMTGLMQYMNNNIKILKFLAIRFGNKYLLSQTLLNLSFNGQE